MSIENINELEPATIKIAEDGELEDLYLAIYKNNTMNFTKFSNLPVYVRNQIDAKLENFEKDMTLKMQECNILNKVYRKDESGKFIETYLTLDEIAKKMGNIAYKEIGVRYNISTVTGQHTTSKGKNVIRRGNTTLIAGPDLEPSLLSPAFSKLDVNGNEVPIENIFARDYHPWNKMKKMQISMDSKDYNYDLSIDNGGNYFTEVPLYYIDQKYIIEESYQVTGYDGNTHLRYRPIMDITGIWNAMEPLECIPEEYQTDSYSIGMYKWVCEYPLYGYRPAGFFIRKVNKIPTIDNGTYDSSVKRYVKIEINNEIYYVLYKNYLESNLKTGEVPSLYCLEETDSSGYNTKILTSKHYFGCYEISNDSRNSIVYSVSRPNKTMAENIMRNMRTYIKNNGSDYYMLDLRSKVDFFDHLIDIEFATLDSQSVCRGFCDGAYDINGTTRLPLSHASGTSNSFICTYDIVSKFRVGQIISAGGYASYTSGMATAFYRKKYVSSRPISKDIDFTIDDTTPYYRNNTDNIPTYSQNVEDSVDGKTYYLTNIGLIGDVYVTIIENESDLPKYTTSNKLIQVCFCRANNNLYVPVSTNSKSDAKLYKMFIDSDIEDMSELTNYTMIYNEPYKTGTTDILISRNGTIATTLSDGKYPFRWNWIENPYGTMIKGIDGCHISYNKLENVTTNNNSIWYCDVPELFNDGVYDNATQIFSHPNYSQITTYIMPGEKGNCGQIGFDPNVPWVQLISKLGDNVYSDSFTFGSTQTNDRTLVYGGVFNQGAQCGLRHYNATEQINNNNPILSSYIQKFGE